MGSGGPGPYPRLSQTARGPGADSLWGDAFSVSGNEVLLGEMDLICSTRETVET